MTNQTNVLGFIALGCYGAVYLFALILFIIILVNDKKVKSCIQPSLPKIFYVFIMISLLGRYVWLTYHIYDSSSDLTFILNRVAFLTFFTAFTLVLFHWAERVHKNYVTSDKFLPKLGWIFAIVNAILYIIQIVLLTLFLTGSKQREGSPIYELNIELVVSLSLLLSFGFIAYGIRIVLITKFSEIEKMNQGMK